MPLLRSLYTDRPARRVRIRGAHRIRLAKGGPEKRTGVSRLFTEAQEEELLRANRGAALFAIGYAKGLFDGGQRARREPAPYLGIHDFWFWTSVALYLGWILTIIILMRS